jgi:hypothetical protein
MTTLDPRSANSLVGRHRFVNETPAYPCLRDGRGMLRIELALQDYEVSEEPR